MFHGSVLVRRIAGAVVAFAVGSALAAGSASVAEAKGEYHYWNSSGNPLVVTGYGSTAKAYGQWRIADGANGTRSYLDSNTWYYNADNHKKYAVLDTYVNGGYCVSPTYLSCSQAYYYWGSAETSHSNSANQWNWLYANTSLPGTADYGRAGARVCLDVPFRYDPCSGTAWTTGSQY